MRIFHIDDSGNFIGEGLADVDPLDSGRWLVPAGAVLDEPPAVPSGMRAVRVGSVWEVVNIPVIPAPLAQSPAQRRAGEIRARLAAIDMDSIRALRAKSAGKGKSADDTKLAALDAEADTLRAELAALVV